ncbi:phage antirepressor N-terminal domain-containing protein [Gilliamella apicola]|uniref:phage antirepressor N-terminal domain-containing protein n=1 Tax=Gilliamella apicola TaxID=1196095 RepID=UPI00398700B7
MATQLVFNNIPLSIINLNNQIWFTSSELAKALNYSNPKSVTTIYNRNSNEFTNKMTETLKMRVSGNYQKTVRIFSLRGAHLIAMFANTEIARDFRKWVLDILDKEVQKTTPQPATTTPIPIEPTDVKIETVKFYDQDIDVIFHENLPYIIVRQISDNIGLNYTTARDRIQKRNDINHSVKYIKLPTNGGMERSVCLPLAMLNVWLQQLVPSRTAVGETLIRYQRECFNFLFSHFAKTGYKQTTPVMTNSSINTNEPSYEKLTAAQMRELAQKIHEISNQFHFSRTANNAIWFAIRYVTGTPSPNDFDVRHLPLIINECNRINAILTKYTNATKQNERLIISHVIRKRESIDDILDATEREIKSIENLTDNELLKSVKPCYNLATIDIVGQK